MWLASDGPSAVGYLALALVFSIEGGGLIGEIDEFYILESYRGLGAGTRLLEAAESYAIKAGCHRIGLRVSRRNAITRSFYSSRGYSPRSDCDLLQKKANANPTAASRCIIVPSDALESILRMSRSLGRLRDTAT